jgi:hydroxymethylbilane synthase
MSSKAIKIGTRSSELAMYQAEIVAYFLAKKGVTSEIIKIESKGDIDLIQPIYKLGFTGVFTKSLDTALLNNQIDIAVHSLKDVPTNLADGLENIAVLERATTKDILVFKGNNVDFSESLTIGTGSIRRKAQWLHHFPHHKVEGLRGNVNTRLQKIEDHKHWKGAVFAKAGLQRIHLLGDNFIDLNWMIPAPAQGAIVVTALKNNTINKKIRSILNHKPSEICTTIERDFMNGIQAGCSSPVGAIATIKNELLTFKGLIISIDGKEKAEIEKVIKTDKSKDLGFECAQEMKVKHKDLIKRIKIDLSTL